MKKIKNNKINNKHKNNSLLKGDASELIKKFQALRLGNTEKSILDELTFVDFTVGMLLSAGSTRQMFKSAMAFHNWRMSRKRAVKSLQEKGLLEIRKDKVRLTKLGKEMMKLQSVLSKMNDSAKNVYKTDKKKWDGYWHVIIFDIPTSHSWLRRFLRQVLIISDFKKVQYSVYVSKQFPGALQKLLRQYNDLERHVTFFRVQEKDAPKAWAELFKIENNKKSGKNKKGKKNKK